MRNIFVTISLLLIGSLIILGLELKKEDEQIVGTGQTLEEKIADIQGRIESQENAHRPPNPKYLRIPKTTDPSTGIDYEVHEYETPNGDTGYNVLFYDEWGRLFKSIGYGPEAANRTWEFTLPTLTSTST